MSEKSPWPLKKRREHGTYSKLFSQPINAVFRIYLNEKKVITYYLLCELVKLFDQVLLEFVQNISKREKIKSNLILKCKNLSTFKLHYPWSKLVRMIFAHNLCIQTLQFKELISKTQPQGNACCKFMVQVMCQKTILQQHYMKLFLENKANVTLQDLKKSKYHFLAKMNL